MAQVATGSPCCATGILRLVRCRGCSGKGVVEVQNALMGYFRWVVYHPWQAIFLSFVLVVLASYGIKDFKTSNDPRSFFSEESEDFDRLTQLEDTYGASDVVLVAIHPKNNNVFTPRNLDLLEKLTATYWKMPDTVRVQSIANFPNTEVDGDDLEVQFLVEDALNMTPEEVAKVRDVAVNEPQLVRSLVSEKGHVAVVLAKVLLDEERTQAPKVTYWAKDRLQEFKEQYPDVDFYMTGTVVFTEAMAQATRDGFKVTLPLGMLASIIALLFMLRSVLGMVYTMTIVNVSVLAAMGISIMAGVVFQPVSSYASVIILTLGIADCMHLLISYQQQLAKGDQHKEALLESLRINFQPIFLTSITTAVGFICLNTSESPPLRDLGNITALGVMLAFFFSITLLPALVSLSGKRMAKSVPEKNRLEASMVQLGNGVIKHYKSVLIVTSIIILVVASLLPMNRFNDVWSEYFDDTFEVRQASDFLSKELAGFQAVAFRFPAKDEGGISEPEYLDALDRFRDWAEAQPNIAYTLNFVDVIKRLNRDMNGGEEAFYSVPQSRELASQYLLMYEMSLPYGLGLDNQITMDKDETFFSIVLEKASSSELRLFAKRAEEWIAQNMPDYMQTKATGVDKLFSDIGVDNSVSIVKGTLLALLMISAMIMVALRSLRYGFLSILPNVLPALMAFGLWALISGDISLSVSIVGCITMGVVVDDTVHFLSKYTRAKREQNLNTEASIVYSFRTVGVALVATSVILAVNFIIMAFSSFQPASGLGLLTAITIVLALFVDFLFLPALLLVMDKNKKTVPGE